MKMLTNDRGAVGLESLPWMVTQRSLVKHAGWAPFSSCYGRIESEVYNYHQVSCTTNLHVNRNGEEYQIILRRHSAMR